MKTRKILDITEIGFHVICIKTEDKYNPYKLYHVYYEDGTNHRKLIEKYADFNSVLERCGSFFRSAKYITEHYNNGVEQW